MQPWRRQIQKRAQQGFRGFPVGTLLFYGPDNRRASKVVAGVKWSEGDEPLLRKWFCEEFDVRASRRIGEEVLRFFAEHGVRTVATAPGIAGCPHEEGIDYPSGEACPRCPFWKYRDRWKEALEPGQDSRLE